MSLRDIIDFSTFTDLSTAFDLYSNSIRRAFSYDSYGNKTKFRAVVLTNPIPVSPSDLQYFTGTPENKTSKKFDRYVYRARILGANSPHEFLPNPCDATYAIDPDQALKVIEMHTLFISDVEFGTAESLPRINTVVEVELEKNTFGYNLQYGKHIKVSYNDDKPATGTTVSCDSLKSVMENASGSPSGGSYTGPVTVGDNLTDRGVSYTKHFDETAPALHYPANGPTTSQFGNRFIFNKWSFHTGIDISNVVGTEIRAALDGVVTIAFPAGATCKDLNEGGDNKCTGGAGNFIMIKHAGGKYVTKYMHIQEGGFLVKKGDTVKKGQPIARMGNTGSSTGSHLHFEYRKWGGRGGQFGPTLNPSFHFEETFEDSKDKKNIEKSTGILQAEKTEVAEPKEAVGSQGVQETEPTGAETSTTPEEAA